MPYRSTLTLLEVCARPHHQQKLRILAIGARLEVERVAARVVLNVVDHFKNPS